MHMYNHVTSIKYPYIFNFVINKQLNEVTNLLIYRSNPLHLGVGVGPLDIGHGIVTFVH